MEKIQKLNLRIQKLIFPGTRWRGLALIGAKKNPGLSLTISDCLDTVFNDRLL